MTDHESFDVGSLLDGLAIAGEAAHDEGRSALRVLGAALDERDSLYRRVQAMADRLVVGSPPVRWPVHWGLPAAFGMGPSDTYLVLYSSQFGEFPDKNDEGQYPPASQWLGEMVPRVADGSLLALWRERMESIRDAEYEGGIQNEFQRPGLIMLDVEQPLIGAVRSVAHNGWAEDVARVVIQAVRLTWPEAQVGWYNVPSLGYGLAREGRLSMMRSWWEQEQGLLRFLDVGMPACYVGADTVDAVREHLQDWGGHLLAMMAGRPLWPVLNAQYIGGDGEYLSMLDCTRLGVSLGSVVEDDTSLTAAGCLFWHSIGGQPDWLQAEQLTSYVQTGWQSA